ncbi:MAG: short-chain Z-isoprenyl diphosphate synthase [Pseudonocardiales bacterium]|nr:short-chain Z-isoprenyl diphosphate synthase [Pseudonocardiales bacterium]
MVGVRDAVYAVYERRLRAHPDGLPIPRHVAIMIDGNRRWARAAGFDDVSHGHVIGARHIANLLDWCTEAGVAHVTIWLLSTDNLHRPADELDPLLRIIAGVAEELSADGKPWRVQAVGALDLLPSATTEALKKAEERTAGRDGLTVNVAVGYGGRREIADAVRSLLQEHAAAGTSIEELAEVIDVDHIAEHLYTKGQPDPDLVIRTSGEQRLSGFLLWQSVHSEFYFCDALWPDFRKIDFLRALRDYGTRQRRYGG